MEAGRRSGRSGGEVFGRLIAARRAGLGLSQEDLAARIDSSQANVARIEEGQPPSTETLKRLAAALNTEPGTGTLRRSLARATASGSGARTPWSSLGRSWLWGGLAIAVLVPVVVILGGRSSGTDGGDPSQQSPQAASAAPAFPPVAVGGAQGKSRKTEKSRKRKRPEKKSATPVAAVSEPSFARAPTTKRRSPATVQPASEPVASPPAPSSSSGGASNDPPPQVQHGIGAGGGWHGIGAGGG